MMSMKDTRGIPASELVAKLCAEQKGQGDRKMTITIELPAEMGDLGNISDAAFRAQFAYQDAANIFRLIYEGMASGNFSGGNSEIISLCELCRAAFEQKAETDGLLLNQLHFALKGYVSERDREKEAEQ